MTQDQKRDNIRQACIKANPEKFSIPHLEQMIIEASERDDFGAINDLEAEGIEVRNKTIHLADVLLATEGKPVEARNVYKGFRFLVGDEERGEKLKWADWNLRADDLNLNPQCWDFLYELLQ